MLKSLLLVAGFAVSVNAYLGGNARQRIANDYEVANMQLEEVRAKYGMRTLQAHNYLRKDKESVAANWDGVSLLANPFESARGFAYGLQFSPNKPGECYYAVDSLLTSAQTISNLVATAYNP
jgi:hypothetical protein